MTKSQLFITAWSISRTAAAQFGGSVKSYFTESLKMAYASADKMTVTWTKAPQSSCYYTVTITNGAKHAELFSKFRLSIKAGNIEIWQVRRVELAEIQSLVNGLNNPVEKKQPAARGGRYVELLTVAQAKSLNHGKSWRCSEREIECHGINPMHEGELVCYVYNN